MPNLQTVASLFIYCGALTNNINLAPYVGCAHVAPLEMYSSVGEVSLPSWATEDWTGDDSPYIAIKVTLDQASAKKLLTPALISRYQQEADQDPENPQAQFQWAYASYIARHSKSPVSQTVFPGLGAMERAPFPHSYEYARLSFLIGTAYGPEPRLESIGERLVRRDPKDYDVEYYLVDCIDPNLSIQERDKALKYARDLIRIRPKDPRSFSALGGIYYYLWLVHRDRSSGEKTIAAYKHYLRLGPQSEENRVLAQHIIRRIQSG